MVCLRFVPKVRKEIGRAFFCMLVERRIVILHSFIKKTDKTPQRELNIARARLQEVKNATRQNHI